MKFDRFRRDVCDIMIIVLLLVSFADSVMYAISDNLTTNGRTAIFMLTVLFLIAERQHSDQKYRKYRKEHRK